MVAVGPVCWRGIGFRSPCGGRERGKEKREMAALVSAMASI